MLTKDIKWKQAKRQRPEWLQIDRQEKQKQKKKQELFILKIGWKQREI